MSKLLAKYIKKDLQENYNGDFVKYLIGLSAYESIENFRDAVYACSSLTVKHFQEIDNQRHRYRKDEKIRGVFLTRALTHAGIKRKVLSNFQQREVSLTSLNDKDARQLVNSPSLHMFVKLPSSTYSQWSVLNLYNASSNTDVLVPLLDCLANAQSRTAEPMANLIKMKPRVIEHLKVRHFEKLTERNVVWVMAALHKPAFIKTVLSKNITLESETAKYIGEVITMTEMAGNHVPSEATYMIRLLG